MAAETSGPTAGEYIRHHLQHLQLDITTFEGTKQKAIVDFTVVNVDSIIWSTLLGLIMCIVLWRATRRTRRATAGVPGRFQAAVELLVEMVESQAKGVIHNATSRKLVSPLALTVLVWIFTMNADLSVTMGMAVGVLLVCLAYNIKIKGLGGWGHELVSAPFGSHPVLWPFNFAMQVIEFVAKTVSHGMRLFGNMYAGGLIFYLIALMGGAFTLSLTGVLLGVGHVIAGTLWTLFHILVISLQAFIFMMLTLIYVGQAHDAH